MNQRADSLKKNLQLIGVKPLINRQRWLLSHIMRCNRGENRIERRLRESLRAFCGLTLHPLALDPAEHARQGLLQDRDVLREQKESEREHPESEHRQKAENTADNQQNGERNPDVARGRLAQPADKSGWPGRKPRFKPGEMPVELHLGLFAHLNLLLVGVRC